MNKHILIVVVTVFASVQAATSQGNEQAITNSRFILVESNFGRASMSDQGSKFIGGFGLWGRFSLQEKKRHTLEIGIPLRWSFTSPEEEVLVDYDHSLSASALFRLVLKHPTNESVSFFVGAGPELRVVWKDGDDKNSSRSIPMLQQEIGFKMAKPNAFLFDHWEIGLTSSIPISEKEWKDKLVFASLFVRMSIF